MKAVFDTLPHLVGVGVSHGDRLSDPLFSVAFDLQIFRVGKLDLLDLLTSGRVKLSLD